MQSELGEELKGQGRLQEVFPAENDVFQEWEQLSCPQHTAGNYLFWQGLVALDLSCLITQTSCSGPR